LAAFVGVISIGREHSAGPNAPAAADGTDHRPGLPPILQHDGNLQPLDYGGPLVTLDGKVVGLNILRGSRTASYAIAADVIVPLLDAMKSGNPAPTTRP
jgi:serine protease Do